LSMTIVFSKAHSENCVAIRNILSTYEKASSKRINFTKSVITFSPNVCDSVRRATFETLGLQNGNSHDSYLGLPTVVGRNKKKYSCLSRRECGKRSKDGVEGYFQQEVEKF
ncbi:hypothetical protein PanWU01x14_212980, partial [Parasponia andersonii]